MSSDTPRRIPLAQLTERLAEVQRVHYATLLGDLAKQIEQLLPETGFEQTKVSLLSDFRALLARDLDRFALRLSELAARGARGIDDQLH